MSDFAREHAHSDDINTSHAAAERAESMASRHKTMVSTVLAEFGPLSSEQISYLVGLNTLQVMKRISDLRKEHAVIDSGDRLPTQAGRQAAVWKLKPKET